MISNKADHALLMKAAELGIISSLQSYLSEPLKPGRLKRLFMEVTLMADFELKTLNSKNPNFFIDNRTECAIYLEKMGLIINIGDLKKEQIHIALIVSFCVFFLKTTESKYSPNLLNCLNDIYDYYIRGGVQAYGILWQDRNFNDEWEKLKNG